MSYYHCFLKGYNFYDDAVQDLNDVKFKFFGNLNNFLPNAICLSILQKKTNIVFNFIVSYENFKEYYYKIKPININQINLTSYIFQQLQQNKYTKYDSINIQLKKDI